MNTPTWLETAITNTKLVLQNTKADPILHASATRELARLHEIQTNLVEEQAA